MRRIALLLLIVSGVTWLGLGGVACAQSTPPAGGVAIPLSLDRNLIQRPPGFRITGAQAVKVAESAPTALALHRVKHPLEWEVYLWNASHYEVYFAYHGRWLLDVIVHQDGRLGPTYTGPLMTGVYARGGYGDVFDSPWVLVPFTLMFLLPLLARRPGLAQLDLAAVLSFFVSYALFDHRIFEPGVWLAYPPLLYLMARMLMRGLRPRSESRALRPRFPIWLLAGGLLALIGGRIAVTLAPAQVIDVAHASVIGAYRILHGQSIYFTSAGHGDTYGPLAYLAYVPFQALWPGSWGSLPAARAAAIAFDLLTIGGLIWIGRRTRPGRDGWQLGLLLAWLWAACPFTVLGLVKSTNDGLVAMLLVMMMLAWTSPLRRGVLVGLAAAAKFFPAILLPLALRGLRGGRTDAQRTAVAFTLTVGALIAAFLPSGGIQEMYDHTVGYQLSRSDIFSPWALHPGLAPVKLLVELGVAGLAVFVAWRGHGERGTAQAAALGATLMIAVQLPALHWFYLYIVWFFPLVLIAVLCVSEAPAPVSDELRPEPLSAEAPPVPVLVGAA